MPELPEVEFARRCLKRWLSGHRVVSAQAEPVRIFRQSAPERFEKLRGRLLHINRRGKYLLLTFDSGLGLLAHLGMSGKWVLREAHEQVPHSRARLLLDDGRVLHFQDARMFGRLEVLAAQELASHPDVSKLGVDPCEDPFDAPTLKAALHTSRQPLKVALMDQTRLAGLGNIHAAEALFRAGLHPSRKPQTLADSEWKRLALGIKATLQWGLKSENPDEMQYLQEAQAKNPFLIYGRAGQPCRKCQTTVQALTQGGRTTHFCPHCQPKRGRP